MRLSGRIAAPPRCATGSSNRVWRTFFRDKTGLVIDPYFSGTKIRWLLDTDSRRVRAKAKAGQLAFGTVDTWLVWQLTQGKKHITDVTNASRTLLLNIRTGGWDQELLDVLRHSPPTSPRGARFQ